MSKDCFCLHMARTHESDQYGKKQHSIRRFALWLAAIRNSKRLERGKSAACICHPREGSGLRSVDRHGGV